MTKEDIVAIEQALDIVLPPELLEKYLNNVTAGIEEFPELEGFFISDPIKLIKLNLRLRQRGLQKKQFPKHHFAIGYNHKTDYYLIDLRDDAVQVYSIGRSKTWAYNPEDLTDNHLMGLEGYLNMVPLSFLRMSKEEKTRQELGLPELEITAEEIYRRLDEMQAGIEAGKNDMQ